MGQLKKIISAVEFIEENIKSQIFLDEIAKKTGLSKFHLDRIFTCITGMSLIRYARGRKLAHSLKELSNSYYKIIDIALIYGYSYEQSYIRAFRNEYRITPNKFRKNRPAIEIVKKINSTDFHNISDLGVLYKPRSVFKPSFTLCGVRHLIDLMNQPPEKANAAGKDFFLSQIKNLNDVTRPNVYYGYVIPDYSGPYINAYHPSVEINANMTIPNGFTKIDIPSGEYFVFLYIGFHRPEELTLTQLNSLYKHIYTKQGIPFHLERMDLDRCSSTYTEMEIYVPVLS